jgi:hypothetical protein
MIIGPLLKFHGTRDILAVWSESTCACPALKILDAAPRTAIRNSMRSRHCSTKEATDGHLTIPGQIIKERNAI